jgi:hypothetical protein
MLTSPARRATDLARLAAMPRLEKASSTLMAVTRIHVSARRHGI